LPRTRRTNVSRKPFFSTDLEKKMRTASCPDALSDLTVLQKYLSELAQCLLRCGAPDIAWQG
jgi:hypothetical protein